MKDSSTGIQNINIFQDQVATAVVFKTLSSWNSTKLAVILSY